MFKFSIDQILNPHIWPNQVKRFPKPFRRLLGGTEPRPVADYWLWLDILIGTFCGIALIEGVFKSHTVFSSHGAPLIIASYGASAILCFNANVSPLAQPRNVLIGQFVSSLIGVCIEKLFSLSEAGKEHYWAGGALSVAVASVAMSILNCVHPPGGASALLPCTDARVRDMGWWYLPAQLVSSVLMIAAACVTNNVLRSYPVFWWTIGKVGKPSVTESRSELEAMTVDQHSVVLLIVSEILPNIKYVDDRETIEISGTYALVPEHMRLDDLEMEWLASLQLLMKRANNDRSRAMSP